MSGIKTEIECRRKILRIPERDVLSLIAGINGLPEFVRVPQFGSLPPDVQVCGVHHDYASQSFCFVLQHESFEPSVPGEMLPVIRDAYTTVKVTTEEAQLRFENQVEVSFKIIEEKTNALFQRNRDLEAENAALKGGQS